MRRQYGWRKDLPSEITWFDHEKLRGVAPTPDVTNNRQFIKWVYDQGAEGSCTANSAMGTNRFFRQVNGLIDSLGSRQFLYYVTRSLEGSTRYDAGATIADTVSAEVKFGICLESLWPYSKPLSAKPNAQAYADGMKHQVLSKAPVQQTQSALELVLAAKRPIHFGMTVYESFESNAVAKTGIVPMPKTHEKVLGGHALWLFDYDRPKRKAYGQNSWGAKWGQDKLGIFEIPYDYLLSPDLTGDFWTILAMRALPRPAEGAWR
jgi:C1A family cysteine protease